MTDGFDPIDARSDHPDVDDPDAFTTSVRSDVPYRDRSTGIPADRDRPDEREGDRSRSDERDGARDRSNERDELRATETVVLGIPAYNEASSIATVVASIAKYADEVLVVDDGSDDETATLAERAGATVVRHGEQRGYGAALRTIFREAARRDAAHLVILDADGQHDPDDVPELLRTQRTTGAELVIASRFAGGGTTEMPIYRRFGLAVINTLTNAATMVTYSRSGIADTQCGFRAYSRPLIETLADDPELGKGMEASIDILFHAAREGATIVEVPTTVDYGVDEASTHNPIRHGIRLLCRLPVKVYRERPGRTVALVGGMAGGAALVPVFFLGGPVVALTLALALCGFGLLTGALSDGMIPRDST